jgi:hypothetical protein
MRGDDGMARQLWMIANSQPFDIVKVRVQTAAPGTFKSPLDCATTLLKNEGPLGFYKVGDSGAERPAEGAAGRGAGRGGVPALAGVAEASVRLHCTLALVTLALTTSDRH